MKTKLTILFALAIVFTTVLFYSCDKVEAPFFKPIYTEKNVSFEYIDDAQNFIKTKKMNKLNIFKTKV